jgi:hypothetical protein
MKCKNLQDVQDMLNRLGQITTGTQQIVLAASFAAADLWTKQTPENEDTAELRRQLISLNAKGVWDFDRE